MSEDFIRDTTHNQIASRLRDAFFAYYRYNPSPAVVSSWRNSLRAMTDVLDIASLHDHGILLEYQLPLRSKRIDCIVCGRDDAALDQAVIVELKQWERSDPAEADKLLRSWVGGRQRDVLHPSVQVGQYRQYLEDTHSAFHEGPKPVRLSACSYLHNYFAPASDPLLAPKFTEVLRADPLFDADGAESLAAYLATRLASGQGRPVLARVEDSRFRPSRKLMDHVAETISSQSPWILLDEQLVVFERIRSTVKSGFFGRRKQAIIVRGGPGTGKSVLAINLMESPRAPIAMAASPNAPRARARVQPRAECANRSGAPSARSRLSTCSAVALLFLTWRSPSVSLPFADARVPNVMPPDLLD